MVYHKSKSDVVMVIRPTEPRVTSTGQIVGWPTDTFVYISGREFSEHQVYIYIQMRYTVRLITTYMDSLILGEFEYV